MTMLGKPHSSSSRAPAKRSLVGSGCSREMTRMNQHSTITATTFDSQCTEKVLPFARESSSFIRNTENKTTVMLIAIFLLIIIFTQTLSNLLIFFSYFFLSCFRLFSVELMAFSCWFSFLNINNKRWFWLCKGVSVGSQRE